MLLLVGSARHVIRIGVRLQHRLGCHIFRPDVREQRISGFRSSVPGLEVVVQYRIADSRIIRFHTLTLASSTLILFS